MQTRGFFLLAGITAAAVAGTLLLVIMQNAGSQGEGTGEALLPKLKKCDGEIVRFEIGRPDAPVIIRRDGKNGYRVSNLSDYPASAPRLGQLLFHLEESVIREKKTADPERLSELGLDDKSAQTLRLFIAKDGKETLLDEIRTGRYSAELKGTYVRRPEGSQSWLASEELAVSPDAIAWADRRVVNIERERVKRLEILHADGKQVAIAHDEIGTDFVLQGLPPGKEVTSNYDVNLLATAFEALELADVKRVSEVYGKSSILVTLQTFDGLELYADFSTKDGMDWAKIYATFNPALRGRAPEGTQPQGPAVTRAPEEQVMKEVEAINARTSGWYYQIPKEKYGLLSRRMKDLLKEQAKSKEQPVKVIKSSSPSP